MISRADSTMMGHRVMLGEVISQVKHALVPIDQKVTGIGTILNPKIPHSHGFGATQLDGAIGNAGSGGVVGLDGSGALRVTKFVESGANGFGLTAVVKQATQFGFSSRGNHLFEFVGDDKDRTVVGRRRFTGNGRDGGIKRLATEEEVPSIA